MKGKSQWLAVLVAALSVLLLVRSSRPTQAALGPSSLIDPSGSFPTTTSVPAPSSTGFRSPTTQEASSACHLDYRCDTAPPTVPTALPAAPEPSWEDICGLGPERVDELVADVKGAPHQATAIRREAETFGAKEIGCPVAAELQRFGGPGAVAVWFEGGDAKRAIAVSPASTEEDATAQIVFGIHYTWIDDAFRRGAIANLGEPLALAGASTIVVADPRGHCGVLVAPNGAGETWIEPEQLIPFLEHLVRRDLRVAEGELQFQDSFTATWRAAGELPRTEVQDCPLVLVQSTLEQVGKTPPW